MWGDIVNDQKLALVYQMKQILGTYLWLLALLLSRPPLRLNYGN